MRAVGVRGWLSWIGVAALALGFGATPAIAEDPLKGDAGKAAKVRDLTLELSVDEAVKELGSADDQLLAVERARALLYQGKCDEASEVLLRPDFAEVESLRGLKAATFGCQFATAGAVVLEDEASGTWLRVQDDEDKVLAPFMFDVVKKARKVFEDDLGVTMPKPLRIELVRDQHALSSLTGLSLEAARTTGTIGIAKWGRVTMVSPRASDRGYNYLDTLAHELTHMALTRASGDRAPLWLQEGVARIEESRWRPSSPFDDSPAADDLAALGIKKNIGPDIDKIGPSIALLPSAEQAQITYAKVQSFMRFYGREAGDGAMNKLLVGFKQASDPDDLEKVVASVSGTTFQSWATQWKSAVLAAEKPIPEGLEPGAKPAPGLKEARKRYRLGQLLLDRSHTDAAAIELGRGHTAMPNEASTRALYARAVLDQGDSARAKSLVEKATEVITGDARWWSLRAVLGVPEVETASQFAIGSGPYDPAIACEEKAPPALPSDPARRALCEAARAKPRAR